MPAVQIYDTTLRDGTQGEGISLSVEDKIKIARKLDAMGFHYIEGGWPGSNPKDLEFFRRIKDYPLTNAQVTAFGCTRKPGVPVEQDANLKALLESGVTVATIFGKTWDFHVLDALNTTLEENLAMIEESLAYLKDHGLTVFYDAEHFFDGYKANPAYALATLQAARRGGAAVIVLCDTNGGTLPQEVSSIVQEVKEQIDVPLGIHAHNDCELAVANTLAAVQQGVVQVQGTVNGYGERCGNSNLCSIIPILHFKLGLSSIPADRLPQLTAMSRYVSEVANVHPNPQQPFVGTSAFAHKGGIHVSALLKNAATYEHIAPEQVGNKRRVLISELAGTSNLLYKYKEMNVDIDKQSAENRELLKKIKDLESKGYQFEGAEGSFELLMRQVFNGYKKPFTLENLRIIIELKENQPVHTEAVIKMRVKDEVVHTAAEGDGPVHALDNALRKVLETAFPKVQNMKLNDYKVRVLDEQAGTEAPVRVLIETGDGSQSWSTVGVSTNIIEASWQALVDSLAYGLLKSEQTQ